MHILIVIMSDPTNALRLWLALYFLASLHLMKPGILLPHPAPTTKQPREAGSNASMTAGRTFANTNASHCSCDTEVRCKYWLERRCFCTRILQPASPACQWLYGEGGGGHKRWISSSLHMTGGIRPRGSRRSGPSPSHTREQLQINSLEQQPLPSPAATRSQRALAINQQIPSVMCRTEGFVCSGVAIVTLCNWQVGFESDASLPYSAVRQ